jgi:hypothetical protein
MAAMEQDPITTLLSAMPSPEMVRALEQVTLGLHQVDLSTEHLVHGGMYCRFGMIPSDTLLTGAITRHDNVCMVVGDITVTTDQGVRRLTGINILPALAGAKRAGITHADTWWATIHATPLTDVREIEDDMTPESAMLQTRRDGIEFVQPEQLEA